MTSYSNYAIKVVRGFFQVAGLVAVGGVCIASYAAYSYKQEQAKFEDKARSIRHLPKEFILELDFGDSILVEKAKKGISSYLFQPNVRSLEIRKAVNGIKKAALDKRVNGLFISGTRGIGTFCNVQELRSAIDFYNEKSKDKKFPSVYFSNSFFGQNNTIAYYLASSLNKVKSSKLVLLNEYQVDYMKKVVIQPGSIFNTLGFSVMTPFIREFLDKYEIEPIWYTREEYKNGAAFITEKTYSESNREQQQLVINGIAKSRGITNDMIKEIIDRMPITSKEALSNSLVDDLLYRDEIYEKYFKDSNDEIVPKVTLAEYISWLEHQKSKKENKKTKIAIIRAIGDIKEEEDQVLLPPMGDRRKQVTSMAMAKQLDRVRKDEDVKAVVIRVNSPGGAAVSSEAIRREIEKTKEKGKKIIISMSDMATSGGYLISCMADKIVANPGTLTGSIGIIFGKINLKNFLKEKGINVEGLITNKNALLLSPFEELKEDQKEALETLIDSVYEDFLKTVSSGRHLPIETVKELAKGRIWIGEDAFKLGLIDKLGGLNDAIDLAAEMSGIKKDEVLIEELERENFFIKYLREKIGIIGSSNNNGLYLGFLNNGWMDFKKMGHFGIEARSIESEFIFDSINKNE